MAHLRIPRIGRTPPPRAYHQWLAQALFSIFGSAQWAHAHVFYIILTFLSNVDYNIYVHLDNI